MARIADKIKTINGSKETLKLSFVGTPGRSEQAEMIIVDSDGDQIHVVCKQDQLKAWKMDLNEGCSYVMHNFKVTKNDGQYRVCDHPYKLTFIGVTVVRQCGLDGLPLKKYRFVDFLDIIAGQLQFALLVDIIGVVDEVVFHHISPRSKRVVFKLMNLSNELVSCTLWDDYCHENEGPIIVLLTNARIKEGQGSYPCSVSNSLKASKLTINEPLAPIEEFNQKYLPPILSSRETFISKSEAKSISEINNLCEEFVCVTVGTITRIVMDNHSWCYPSCIQCYKKTDVYPKPFVCPCGKHNDRAYLTLLYVFPDIELKSWSIIKMKIKNFSYGITCSKIEATTPFDSNDLVHDECQSISITVDHDPLIGLPLTPTK
ncbi:Replication protein A DNA-binding subunit C [Glycine max]|nr:Replication protein A DNA-binding subunit C [Glycine max]